MLITNKVADIVAEWTLPSDQVKACHLQDLLNVQDRFELKAAPRLRKEFLQFEARKGHFASMDVGTSRSVINRRTGTGFQLFSVETQDPSYLTTACFVDLVNRS